jgi:rubrerythrin
MHQKELELIKQAILNEIEGYEFYKMAASQTETAETKEAFLSLASEEMKHVEWLKDLYTAMKENKTDDFDLATIQDPPSPHIFKWENVDRKYASLAVSVFSIGMQMEQSAVKYYTEAMGITENNVARQVYEKLIDWEKQHYIQFADEYEVLKKDWWTTQSYAPF